MGSTYQVDAQHIAPQGGGFEPQRKNNWAIEFIIGNGQSEQVMTLSLKGSLFPKESNVKKSIKYFNETRHYAGSVTPFEALSVKYHDYVDRQILSALYEWRRMVWDPSTGAIGLASEYKKPGRLYFYPPNVVDGGSGAARTWRLIGCWPVSVTTDDLDMESDGDNIEITLEVSIDRALPEFSAGSAINQGLTAQSVLGRLSGYAGGIS
jgi:hypothetical protein